MKKAALRSFSACVSTSELSEDSVSSASESVTCSSGSEHSSDVANGSSPSSCDVSACWRMLVSLETSPSLPASLSSWTSSSSLRLRFVPTRFSCRLRMISSMETGSYVASSSTPKTRTRKGKGCLRVCVLFSRHPQVD